MYTMMIISAHQTLLGHCFSSSALILSIISNSVTNRFCKAVLSTVLQAVESIRTDPSVKHLHAYAWSDSQYQIFNFKGILDLYKKNLNVVETN